MLLYLHIPFCVRKCRYCDFASFPFREGQDFAYVRLLLQEAKLRLPDVTEPIETVFLGGGTPSLLSPDALKELLNGLQSLFDLSSLREFTAEANPGTLNQAWLDTALEGGVSRLSLGMQARQDPLLFLLGRIHRFEDVETSVFLARAAGFQHLNLDLIFGIPTQTVQNWEETLRAAMELDPDHISAYGLIVEEGTPLKMDLQDLRLTLPDPEEEREMYDMALCLLTQNGYSQYEISNFAREGCACLHNIGYWRQIPYLGLGLSAASMLHPHRTDSGLVYTRSVSPDSLKDYEQMVREGRAAFPEPEIIDEAASRFETLMLGLRMNEGISESRWLRLHGKPIPENTIQKMTLLARQGLMIQEGESWRLSRRGMDVQNSILVELMDEGS